jgi:hypothetical protein
MLIARWAAEDSNRPAIRDPRLSCCAMRVIDRALSNQPSGCAECPKQPLSGADAPTETVTMIPAAVAVAVAVAVAASGIGYKP